MLSAGPSGSGTLLLLLTLLATSARADEPLLPASDAEVRSPNGRCAARALVAANRVEVSGRSPDGRAVSWIIPGWHRDLSVADDCCTVGVGYPGLNLLALGGRDAGTAMMTFVHAAGPGRVVRLGELYADLAVLPRTVSHWLWQSAAGWDGERWSVRTVDGRTLEFRP